MSQTYSAVTQTGLAAGDNKTDDINVTVPGTAPNGSYAVKVTVTDVTANKSGSDNSNNAVSVQVQPTLLVFTTSSFSIGTNVCSPAMMLQTRDANGPRNPTSTLTIGLSSSSGTGKFYSGSSCQLNQQIPPQASPTITTNSTTSAAFFFKDSTVGRPLITALSSPLGLSATQRELIGTAGAPTITTISPASKAYGDAAFTMTVNGTNFFTDSVVNFNGSPRATAFVSGTQLTASVPATDLTTVGTDSITVVTLAPGGGTSNSPTFAVNKATVDPHITADNKVYDGTTAATILTRTLTGVIGTDDVSLTGGTATFADKNFGTGKTVTATGLSLTGTKAGNYQLSSTTATTTGNIDKRAITVSATTNSKTYDSNTTAAATPAVTTGTIAPGDTANFTEAYSTATAGTNNKTLVPSGTVTDGNGGANYNVTFANFTTGTISAATLTATLTAQNKTYDGDNLEPDAKMSCSLTGVLSGDSANVNCAATSGTFNTSQVATANLVTATVTISGTAAGNYTLGAAGTTLSSTSATASASITTKAITATLTAQNKTYDGTNTEPDASMSCSLTGVVPADSGNVSCAASSGTFNGSNVGAHTVTATATISGTAAGNYTLGAAGTTFNSTSATASASITTKAEERTVGAENKT